MNPFEVALTVTSAMAGSTYLISILTCDVERKRDLAGISTTWACCALALIAGEIVTILSA